MNSSIKFPIYAQLSLLLIGLYVFVSMLSIVQDILLPLIYASIIAISINPIVNYLVSKKINRTLSIAGVLTVASLIIISGVIFLSSQADLFKDALPQLTSKFQELLHQIVSWIAGYFDISAEKINAWISNAYTEILQNSNTAIGTTLTTIGGLMATAVLTPVYIFMILYYQPHLLKFIHKLFGSGNDTNVSEVLSETKTIVQSYLSGLFIEFAIIAVLNSLGLLILGIDYAILLGIAGALLNVIPYLGGVIAMFMFAVIALITKTPVYVLYVIGLYTIIQLIDNNYIVPKIIGSKVKLNALISIIVVIAGGALWGIPGMFLSIPITAIIKLICDHIDSLKSWGFLLGEIKTPQVRRKTLENVSNGKVNAGIHDR